MAFKFIALFALASVASAGHLAVAPAYAHGAYAVAAPEPAYIKSYAAPTVVKTVEYEAPAQYDFSYGVSDSLTGDHKSQAESRQGDNVHGSYSLIDSDGFKRTVEYTADEHNGFNAVVHREPLAHAVAAPVTKVISTPVAQYAPAHYAAQYAPAHYAAQYAPAHYAAQYAPAHYTAQYAPVAKVASVATPISYSSAGAPVAYSAYSTPVTKVVSQVAAPAHYAPSIVAGAGYYPGAHYAPAAYTTYGGHYAPSTYTVHSGQVYHH